MEEEIVTAAFMLKWSAIAMGVSFAVGALGALFIGLFDDKTDRAAPVGAATTLIGCGGFGVSCLAFFISLIWHIVKSFMGG